MQNYLDILEFQKIKEDISSFALTQRSKLLALELSAFENEKKLEIEYSLLSEVDKVLHFFGSFPISFSQNIIPLISHAKKGGVLSIKDLHMVAEDIITSSNIFNFIKKLPVSYINLHQFKNSFFDILPLEKKIHSIINKSLLIEDHASDELFLIRKNIKKIESTLSRLLNEMSVKYKSILSDSSSTIRDGHFVLPVKTNEKFKIKGIIHDVSDSGLTTFIEPEEIVNLNNSLFTLHYNEKEEIQRILKQLTLEVLKCEDEVLCNNELIAHLDFLVAKQKYGNKYDCVFPVKSEFINIIGARHPLIEKDKVVANNFILTKDKRMVIISGPNAGGKTVVLKTLGLMVLFFKCGLMVPCKEANIPFIKDIYLDIGDSQSLKDDLSTFSSHIKNIQDILSRVDKNSLVLLDELGTGTDPKLGEALAYSIANFLLETNCFTMITSHFNALKELAFSNVNIENGSMIFDEKNLTSTYKFYTGVAGESYAFEVASRIGLDERIITSSKKFIKEKSTSNSEEIMKELRKQMLEVDTLKDKIKKSELELEKEKKKFEIEKRNFEIQKERLFSGVEQQKSDMIKSVSDKLEKIIKNLSNPNLKLHEVVELKHITSSMLKSKEVEVFDENISINDYVSIPSLGVDGKVVRINNDNVTIISDNGLSFNTKRNLLTKINIKQKASNKKTVKRQNISFSDISLELNIIGKTVEEGVREVEKYLDTCLLQRIKQVRIIHGFGSGRLRAGVHSYLKTLSFIKSFHLAGEYDGGGGATIVVFND